jgi:leucyl/phenylalanyl-tRNA---protein transferase
VPVEPPAGRWAFPPVDGADEDGLVGVGADLEPGTILAAYRRGLFPMPLGHGRHLGWWSPDPRAVLPLDGLHVSRSLRRSLRRFEIRVNTAFDEVIEACANPRRPHGWISQDIRFAYRRLHEMGWVHSVEAWHEDGDLAGGLYGVAGDPVGRVLDVQWMTPHLASLGAVDVARKEYLDLLADALTRPLPPLLVVTGQ